RVLDLSNNQLASLPPGIGQFTNLRYLYIDGNSLHSPPPEVIAQGKDAIKDYLRNQAAWHMRQMITGAAGGVGMLAVFGLLIRWRLRSRRKDKKKRT
ncbi:MAG: leucine-rich repeat domain-containing protein, partial [Aggregatilineales bacterium]